jgi:hypothetical protein
MKDKMLNREGALDKLEGISGQYPGGGLRENTIILMQHWYQSI